MMKTSYDIVLVIPFFNEQNYIRKTLRCIKEQKVNMRLTWKVLFIDNNSTDATSEIVREEMEDGKIAYEILREIRPGTVYSRTKGLEKALKIADQLVVSTDADTVFTEQFIENSYKDVIGKGVDALSGQRNKNKKLDLWERIKSPEIVNIRRKVWNLEFMLFGPYFFGCYFAVTRDFLAKIQDYQPHLHQYYMGEDVLLSRRLYFQGAEFVKSSTAVTPSPRRTLYLGDKIFSDFTGNEVASHNKKSSFTLLDYSPLSSYEVREVRDRLIKFESERLLWSLADASIFWSTTGSKYVNAYNVLSKTENFVGIRLHPSVRENYSGNINTLYTFLKKNYVEDVERSLRQYLNV